MPPKKSSASSFMKRADRPDYRHEPVPSAIPPTSSYTNQPGYSPHQQHPYSPNVAHMGIAGYSPTMSSLAFDATVTEHRRTNGLLMEALQNTHDLGVELGTERRCTHQLKEERTHLLSQLNRNKARVLGYFSSKLETIGLSRAFYRMRRYAEEEKMEESMQHDFDTLRYKAEANAAKRETALNSALKSSQTVRKTSGRKIFSFSVSRLILSRPIEALAHWRTFCIRSKTKYCSDARTFEKVVKGVLVKDQQSMVREGWRRWYKQFEEGRLEAVIHDAKGFLGDAKSLNEGLWKSLSEAKTRMVTMKLENLVRTRVRAFFKSWQRFSVIQGMESERQQEVMTLRNNWKDDLIVQERNYHDVVEHSNVTISNMNQQVHAWRRRCLRMLAGRIKDRAVFSGWLKWQVRTSEVYWRAEGLKTRHLGEADRTIRAQEIHIQNVETALAMERDVGERQAEAHASVSQQLMENRYRMRRFATYTLVAITRGLFSGFTFRVSASAFGVWRSCVKAMRWAGELKESEDAYTKLSRMHRQTRVKMGALLGVSVMSAWTTQCLLRAWGEWITKSALAKTTELLSNIHHSKMVEMEVETRHLHCKVDDYAVELESAETQVRSLETKLRDTVDRHKLVEEEQREKYKRELDILQEQVRTKGIRLLDDGGESHDHTAILKSLRRDFHNALVFIQDSLVNVKSLIADLSELVRQSHKEVRRFEIQRTLDILSELRKDRASCGETLASAHGLLSSLLREMVRTPQNAKLSFEIAEPKVRECVRVHEKLLRDNQEAMGRLEVASASAFTNPVPGSQEKEVLMSSQLHESVNSLEKIVSSTSALIIETLQTVQPKHSV